MIEEDRKRRKRRKSGARDLVLHKKKSFK